MNTELSVEELLDPLQTVIGVVEKKQTLPILSHVLIQLKEKKLTLTTTDMELEISASSKIKSDSEVTFTIYAKDLIDIVRKLPEKTLIKFKIEEKKIYLNANKNTFELNTFDHLDFPALPKTQNTSVINIKQELLKELIENTSFSMGNQDIRAYLNGLFFELDQNSLTVVATDGHRLSIGEVKQDNNLEERKTVILPRKAVGEVRKLIDSTDGLVKVIISNTKAKFIFPNSILTTKLIEGSFPDYQRVIPKENLNKLVVLNSDFSKAIDRVSTVSLEKSRAVKLSLSNNLLMLKVNSHDLGNATEELDVKYTSDPIDIGFNARYLLDIASQIKGKEIELSLSDSASPALITDPDQEGVIFVLMPMRV